MFTGLQAPLLRAPICGANKFVITLRLVLESFMYSVHTLSNLAASINLQWLYHISYGGQLSVQVAFLSFCPFVFLSFCLFVVLSFCLHSKI